MQEYYLYYYSSLTPPTPLLSVFSQLKVHSVLLIMHVLGVDNTDLTFHLLLRFMFPLHAPNFLEQSNEDMWIIVKGTRTSSLVPDRHFFWQLHGLINIIT